MNIKEDPSSSEINKTSRSVDLKKINDLVDLSRQKKFKIEQLKNNTYSELGFTFKPAISESSKYKVPGTFEERNFINYYPNRDSLLSKKKYGNSNKEVSSILSYSNKNINNNNANNKNIELDNASKISVRTFNFNNNYNINSNNNYVNNKENSFSSSKHSSLKSKWVGNTNKNSTPFLNSNSKRKNNFSNTKNKNQKNNNSNTTNNYNENSINNNTNNINNNNKTKSIKSSICNFSTMKNTPDIKGNDFINKIAHESLNNQELNYANEENLNYDYSNINNKKITKLQETRDLVKRINSKVKSNSNKDFEFLNNTIDEVYNNNVLESTNKINQEKNVINEKYFNKESLTGVLDESKSNYFNGEKENKNTNNSKNRNKNYGNIVYSINSNDNGCKSINNSSGVVSNNDKNNQENSNFKYSMSKTDGEVYFDK